jgi:hypothetical protein
MVCECVCCVRVMRSVRGGGEGTCDVWRRGGVTRAGFRFRRLRPDQPSPPPLTHLLRLQVALLGPGPHHLVVPGAKLLGVLVVGLLFNV